MTSDVLKDQAEIRRLFEDGDEALISGDPEAMKQIYAEDYIQSDENGNLSTRQDVIDRLASGTVRFVSMKSTGRRIRLLREDVAVVHGSEEDVVVQEGKQSSVRYIYMDVVMKREDRWQIVASQLVKL
ncbi:MAG TPA: nuclear transport factor 2 family protein [Candidatus Sulfotelmatobacter sp.]|nr:nuclear transport factor 2 family protein [Candidatus Sulfotelmatobacter sp.]